MKNKLTCNSVKDKLPDSIEICLVFDSNNNCGFAVYGYGNWAWNDSDDDTINWNDIQYWIYRKELTVNIKGK